MNADAIHGLEEVATVVGATGAGVAGGGGGRGWWRWRRWWRRWRLGNPWLRSRDRAEQRQVAADLWDNEGVGHPAGFHGELPRVKRLPSGPSHVLQYCRLASAFDGHPLDLGPG